MNYHTPLLEDSVEAVSPGTITFQGKYFLPFTRPRANIKMKRIRAIPQQLSINLNLQLPAGTQQQFTQQQIQAIQQQIMPLVTEEVNRQSPISGYDARITNSNWHKKKWS